MFSFFQTVNFRKQVSIVLTGLFIAAVLLQGCKNKPDESRLEEMSESGLSVARSPATEKLKKEEGRGKNLQGQETGQNRENFG